MSNLHQIALWYLALINLAALLLYGWDKFCALRHQWRVPETVLLLIAALGGSIGALAGMKVFHHKTLHWKFKVGVPLLLLLQVAGVFYWHVR